MRRERLKKFIMIFLAFVLLIQPLSTVLVFAKGNNNKFSASSKLLSEKLNIEEDIDKDSLSFEESNKPEFDYANLTVYFIGDLPKDADSEIVLISRSGEEFSKVIKDNKPVKFEGLSHDIYDAELYYLDVNGNEVLKKKTFDLSDKSKDVYEFDFPTDLLQWTYGEVEITPNYEVIELLSPNNDVVEKLFFETEIQGDELVLRGVKEEAIDEKDSKKNKEENFIMHVYDANKDKASDIVSEELKLTKEEKKKFNKRIYESDYRIDLRDLKNNELEIDFIRGKNQSYIHKIHLNNFGYENYKNSIEKNEKEKVSNENNSLVINDEEVFKLDGLSPMIMMRSLSPRGIGDTW
ncbi:MAG: hypothetical protein Q4P31_07110, partial [Andreesenia angusta]|nr:hypothetical protein [Andreesenia angusta]